jgi:DNA-binding NarL/FixJ family response regulator
MQQKKINIALVDDHTLFRSGIANLLLEFDDIKIVFEAPNGKELQQLLPKHNDIDVILMDINMPIIDGYAATEWVKEKYPNINILALSMFDDDTAVIKMLKAGAGGYVLKESKPVQLHKAITEISEKGVYINDLVSGKMIKSLQQKAPLSADDEIVLTAREKEFLQLCASDLTYKEIAVKMGIAFRSVDNYREAVFDKLELRSRVGVVLYGIKKGIIIP